MYRSRTSTISKGSSQPEERPGPENGAGLLREAISASPMPAALVNPGWEIAEASPGLRELTGFSGRELRGMPLGFLAGEGLSLFFSEDAFETSLLTRGGGKVPVRAFLSRLPVLSLAAFHPLDGEKRLSAELEAVRAELASREKYLEDFREGIFRMLTDLDRSESELNGALKKLGETRMQLIQSSKMTALGELAASLAHEISQPLTVIKGLAHGMLRSSETGGPGHEKMNLISEASRRMEAIVRHLLAFARVEPPAFTRVDINSVVKDAFIILHDLLLSHSIETVIDLRPVPVIYGNPNRLEQVIINLVTNAKDAMPDGGVLRVSSGPSDLGGRRCARLTVEDTGTGMPGEMLKRIFDPFVTTKEAGKGTGLGLSITNGIIREHRGEIRVESAPGKGAAFHIFIPGADPC